MTRQQALCIISNSKLEKGSPDFRDCRALNDRLDPTKKTKSFNMGKNNGGRNPIEVDSNF